MNTKRILIANRGEIARRVSRTARRLGRETVAVYADPDAAAPFVSEADNAIRIGPAALAESYLSIDAILAAAESSGADAVHPGYGFLSESADFAAAVIAAGLAWIGPSPDSITRMGSKIEARGLAEAAGVPVIPGFSDSQDDTDLAAAADRIGYPVLVKAAAGGGGKGIRIARAPEGFAAALNQARSESMRSFGDDAMIVERFVERPRHVEVQIVGDHHGNVIDLGTRECSVQRRYQKVLEEAPAPNLPRSTRAGLREAARKLAASIGYYSTGTVEFIVDDADPSLFFFLEMNTRLQVEHPVTELVTGVDLVELQLLVADGEPLPDKATSATICGHAFEARINAENADADFAPQTGTVSHLVVPSEVRWDSGIEAGVEITPHYDPMVAKLIVGGDSRPVALSRLSKALDRLVIGGLTTNGGFHRWLVGQPEVVEGRVTTRFLDEADLPSFAQVSKAAEQAAEMWWRSGSGQGVDRGPWEALGSFRLTPHRPTSTLTLVDVVSGERYEIVSPHDRSVSSRSGGLPGGVVDRASRTVVSLVDGQSHTFQVLTRSEAWAPLDAASHGPANAVVSPFPAVVAEVVVAPKDEVVGGDPLIVIEAMKMLHTLSADGPGVVDEVRVSVGEQVVSNQVLITFDTDDVEPEE